MLWLCGQTQKALLKLDGDDFRHHNLHQLLRDHGPSARLAHRVFRWMSETIEYHPGGRQPRRILCFSPHPDDDVISMGGTLIRLIEDGHEVHVAYMTSGNIAVFDHDARRTADLMAELNRMFDIDVEKTPQLEAAVTKALNAKEAGDPDLPEVLRIKTLIRWTEAKNAAGVCGCKEENLHFLDLPFYQTGTIAKRPITEEDVRIVRELIERIEPDQVYVAGDLSDPHGTHRLCAQAVYRAIWSGKRGQVQFAGNRPGGCFAQIGPVPFSRGGQTAGGSALSRGLAGMAAAPDRPGRALKPGGHQAEADGHFPASVAEGHGVVPRPGRSPRVLGAGRGPQHPHRRLLQSHRPAGVLRDGGVRAEDMKIDSSFGVILILEVVEARHQSGYNVWVKFNDGVSGMVDLSDALWGPVFEPLRDVERFKQFKVSDNTSHIGLGKQRRSSPGISA